VTAGEICTCFECKARSKRLVAGVVYIGCIWDRMGWSTCVEICERKECPKGFAI